MAGPTGQGLPRLAYGNHASLRLSFLQIWREALSVRSVWAAIRNRVSDCDPTGVDYPLFIMTYVVPAPYLAGLSSKEAWRLLEAFKEV